jgi:putative ABC transport system permease protein
MKLLRLILKNLRRNLIRTVLSALAIVVLVFVVTLVWSVLAFLDAVTAEKAKDFKAIVTERWQIPSQMPITYLDPLSRGAAKSEQDYRPEDYMSWQFFGGSTDPDLSKLTPQTILFFFAMDPRKLIPMMEDLKDLDPKLVEAMVEDKQNVLIGRERLQKLNKKVGETLRVYGLNYKDIVLDMKIVGTFPDGRYNDNAVMNYQYLEGALDDYKVKNKKAHPMADRSLNLVWLRVPDSKAFNQVSEQISRAVDFRNKPVRCETASSGIASFLDGYRTFIFIFRWLLCPAILATMALVIANAIAISVRERRTEMAVLKVLGFEPLQIFGLVIGEALLIGIICGFLSTATTYSTVLAMGGFKFPIAFFPSFTIPAAALWWGPLIGGLTAFCGSLLPALSARTVKVSDVFSKVT